MAQRSGGFSPTLDPFGGGRGGLGRYNVSGDTIQSLAETEAYAVAVAWANGQASDTEYLDSLRKLLGLTNPGTREQITAQNRLDDAIYTIGRNKLTSAVNDASSMSARQDALHELLAYDTAHLGSMTSHDSQAYREQQDRVAGVRVDLRQARYSTLVEKVNRGKATSQQLLELARALRHEAGADPDADDWTSTVEELVDRVADEKLSDGFQAYQHHRKSGSSLLADIDARLAGMTPGSPSYKALANQREDLAQRVKDEARSLADQKVAGQRASGKMSDSAYLKYLKDAYGAETPGTAEAVAAGNRLRDYTFSLAEDKLRFEVSEKKRPVSDLIRFYRAYQHGMNPGSERWRQLQGAIDSLNGRGSGSGGSGKGKNIGLGPKILGGVSAMADFLGGSATQTGGKSVKPPKDFADLFRVDITKIAGRHWWENNLRSMTDAFQDGRGTWIYYDKRGGAHELPFAPSLMNEMDALNLNYMHAGLSSAKNAKEAQTWIGRVISATKSGQSHGATYTMDVYTKAFGEIERAKQRALAGGRYGEYSNLTREQADLARTIMGIPDGKPLDARYATNPYITADQRGRITADLSKIAPRNIDQQSPFYNPTGDKVLELIRDGIITTDTDPVSGDITAAQMDPNRGYLSQTADGTITLVTIDPATNPEAYRTDELTNAQVPRYRDDNLKVTIRLDGQDVTIYQPIAQPDSQDGVAAGVNAYTIDRPSLTKVSINGGVGQSINVRGSASYRPLQNKATGRIAALPLQTTFTVEKVTIDGRQVVRTVRWVSTDGETWTRAPDPTGVPMRVVVPDSVTISDDGKWMIGGKEATPSQVGVVTHVWNGSDAVAAGAKDDPTWGVGAPGAKYEQRRRSTVTGTLDFRPEAIIDSEELELMRSRQHLRGRSVMTPDDARESAHLSGQAASSRSIYDTVQPGTTPRLEGAGYERDAYMAEAGRRLADIATRAGQLLPKSERTPAERVAAQRRDALDFGVKPPPDPHPTATPALTPIAKVALTAVKGIAAAIPRLDPAKPALKLPPLVKPPAAKKKPPSKTYGTEPTPKPSPSGAGHAQKAL